MNDILVSIVCITYNHVAFIRQCLDGFVMQKTDFRFEVLIHDDASTDGTKEIIQEYVKRYPDIFVPFYEEKNQFGEKDYWKDILFPCIKGKYVALCEGDDYWTDVFKLQKQIDFLENHNEYSICFHSVIMHWEDNIHNDSVFPDDKTISYKKVLNIEDLLKCNFIATCSVVYRWRFFIDSLDLIPDKIIPGDWFLHLLHAQTGKIYFLSDCMGVYRKHSGGIWYRAEQNMTWFKNFGVSYMRFYKNAEEQFNSNFSIEIKIIAMQCYAYALKINDIQWKSDIYDICKINIQCLKFLYIKLLVLMVKTPFLRGQSREKNHKMKKAIKKCIHIKNCNNTSL